jgi:hypothetical protein
MGVDHRYAIKKLCCPGTAPSEQFKAALGVAEEAPPLWLNRGSKANGALIRSADGGMTWQQPAGGFPNHYPSMVEYIEFDPAEPDHLFVGTGGEGARYIYRYIYIKLQAGGDISQPLTAATLGSKYRCVSR